EHGFSYGVFSGAALNRNNGVFFAQGGIKAANTVASIPEYEKELQKFAEAGATDEELDAARQAFIRGLPSALETNDAVSGAMASLVSLGLPLDYYKTAPARVAKLSRADVA